MFLKTHLHTLVRLTPAGSRCNNVLKRSYHLDAESVISAFLSNKSNPALHTIVSQDILSPTQSHLLSLTLQPYIPFPLPLARDTLPQGHHLVYFPTAAVPESRLDQDGTETTYNPGAPFNRRMWAGGHVEWAKEVDLHMGKLTTEQMKLDKLEAKHRSGGGEMIVMSVLKTLFTDDQPQGVVREKRQWVFLKDSDASAARSSSAKALKDGTVKRETSFQHSINVTPAALFRYSALIFNSHAIHLSKEHCLKEGYPDLVLHGPFTLSLLLEAVRATVAKKWRCVSYRGVGPACVGEIVALNVGLEKEGKIEAWAEKGDNIPVMKVVVEFY